MYGDPFARAFEVEIDRDRSISALKKAIVGVKANYFKGIDAEDLDLWKREIPIVDNDPASQTPTLSPDDQLGVAKTVGTVFGGDIPGHHVHVIVKSPRE